MSILFLGYVPLQPGEPACEQPGTPAGMRIETEAEATARLPEHPVSYDAAYDPTEQRITLTLTAQTGAGEAIIRRMMGADSLTAP